MRGQFLHTSILIKPIERAFQDQGARVYREFRAGSGFVDLYVEDGSRRMVIEAETSPKRVRLDVAKAHALGVRLLVILVPNSQIAGACRRRLRPCGGFTVPRDLMILVLPLGVALQWIESIKDKKDIPYMEVSENQKIGKGTNANQMGEHPRHGLEPHSGDPSDE